MDTLTLYEPDHQRLCPLDHRDAVRTMPCANFYVACGFHRISELSSYDEKLSLMFTDALDFHRVYIALDTG